MGKTVYLTQEQVDKLRKIVTEEEKLNMPVDIEPGDNILDKISDKKAEITDVAGSQVANNTNFTITGMEVEGKRFSKKQIIFSLEVFIELGIFAFVQGSLQFNQSVKSDLAKSKIYNTVVNFFNGN
jgi:hypothetical protein